MRSFAQAFLASGLLVLAAQSLADVPDTLNYQGYLTDPAGVAIDGTLDITFRIYDQASGGVPLYEEPQTVAIANGLFSITLGPLPDGIFDGPRWLGIAVSPDAEMTPRVELSSVAYAFEAGDATTVQGLLPVDLQGAEGPPGSDGLACWDLNGNGVFDDLSGAPGDEDTNNDNVANAFDCVGATGAQGDPERSQPHA